MKPKPTLPALTGLRFFAAAWVVCFHFLSIPWMEAHLPRFISLTLQNGYCGVDLFFALSGFILAYTYGGTPIQRPETRRSFWIARFARIYPVYLLSFLLAAPVVLLYRFMTAHGAGEAIGKAAISATSFLTLTQAWIWPMSRTWNGPAWTLSVEALFYASFPFLLPRLQGRAFGKLIGIAALAYLAGMLMPMVQQLSHDALPEFMVLDNPLFHLPVFVMGIATHQLWAQRGCSRSWAAVLVAGGVVAVVGVCAISQSLPRPFLHNGLLAPAFCLIIYGLAHGGWPHRILASRPLILLGESSYSLYLLQYPVWWFAIAATNQFRAMNYVQVQQTRAFPQDVAFFAICFAALIAFSIAVYFTVEKPGRIFIKSRFSDRPPEKSGAPAF